MSKIKVLSLFNGISVAQQALKELGYDVEYYASEIDKYAIQITQKNHPETHQIGSIIDFHPTPLWQDTDLLVGGFPCQSFSIAGNRKGLEDPRGQLVYEMFRVIKEVKPKYLLAENVASMKKEIQEYIRQEFEKAMGEPVYLIQINAALVSAQQRKRIFFTNIPNITQPEDRNIFLKDILEHGKSVGLSALGGGRGAKTGLYAVPVALRNRGEGKKPEYNGTDKANSMTTVQTDSMVCIVKEATKKGYAIAQDGDSIDLSFPQSKTRRGRVGNKVKNLMTSQNIGVFTNSIIRKLTPTECCRLQSLPDGYCDGISNSQQYKCLGNAFNCAVVKHILSFIHNE